METKIVQKLFTDFDSIKQNDENWHEFWSARDLQKLLWYTEWRNFESAIKKAIISCKEVTNKCENHFVDVNKMVELGSGSQREIKDYHLSRYACYLIAQNWDPKKQEIAFAQAYFAVQTRKQEIIE